MSIGAGTQCVHRWILGQPELGAVHGVCRRCGARRAYPAGLQLPPPPQEDDEAEEALDMPALAAEISSMKRSALV